METQLPQKAELIRMSSTAAENVTVSVFSNFQISVTIQVF